MPIQARQHLLFLGLAVLLVATAGCRQGDAPGDTAQATPTAGTLPAVAGPVDPDSPCSLLTDAEVRSIFADAKAGVPERSREEYGIRACVWNTSHGKFVLQQWTAKPDSVDNEIRGLSEGFLDPRNPASKNNVRFETIDGVGDQAMAVVETGDEARGILSDVALLVTQRGDRLLELESSDLPRSERATALQSLTTLARQAAARLQGASP